MDQLRNDLHTYCGMDCIAPPFWLKNEEHHDKVVIYGVVVKAGLLVEAIWLHLWRTLYLADVPEVT